MRAVHGDICIQQHACGLADTAPPRVPPLALYALITYWAARYKLLAL